MVNHEQDLSRTGRPSAAGWPTGEPVSVRLDPAVREVLSRQEAFVLATADGQGVCDISFHAGPPGFLAVLDDSTLAYPVYGGGRAAIALANIRQNPRVGMLLVDGVRNAPGVQIKGRARLVPDDAMRAVRPGLPVLPADPAPGAPQPLWVEVEVFRVEQGGAATRLPAAVPTGRQVPQVPVAGPALPPGAGAGAGAAVAPAYRAVQGGGRQPFAVPLPADSQAWRRAAEEVLAEARQRALAGAARAGGRAGGPSAAGFRGWFSS